MLDLLIASEKLQARVAELAEEIQADYDGQVPLVIGILKGSIYFLTDLTRRLNLDLELDFMQLSSYGGAKTSSGIVQIRKDADTNIEGRNVLIVEDIVDTGATLEHLRELLNVRRPASLRIVALLSKREAKGLQTHVDYVGFEIPDVFVVGYGLDSGERFRNLPDISILRED